MRPVLICFALSLYGSICFGQADSSKTLQQPVPKQVAVPGVDTPVSGGGLTAQTPTNPVPLTQEGDKKGRTQPPSDPRSFGVSVPIKGKAKKDTTQRQ